VDTQAAPLAAIDQAVRLRLLEMEIERRDASSHPALFLDQVTCLDAKTGEHFRFHLNDAESGWYWQRAVLDGWLNHDRSLELKARQIGITWLAAGLALWYSLYQPGARTLIISINEVEAIKVVNRIWDMWRSVPEHLRGGRKVVKPTRGIRPTTEIQWEAPDGTVTSILAMPATATAGHGETATLVILDEYSRQEYAQPTWKSTFPTIDGGGRVIVISTANGVSNPNTGEGNYFHYLYTNADTLGIHASFLPWSLHPERDQDWYDTKANALPPNDRAEQYPTDPDDAFINTGETWYDVEALNHYAKRNRSDDKVLPLYRMRIVEKVARARVEHAVNGPIRVYKEPVPERAYGIGADVATGRAADFSAAYVIDFTNMELVAEYHASIDPDLFGTDLYYLGRWYNDALLAVEMGGGYGEPVIINLRSTDRGRPAYRRLYRHREQTKLDAPETGQWGFPINTKTRPQIISALGSAIRERSLPWMSPGLVAECRTFVRAKSNPSPRAQDGTNDDRVMAACLALHLYSLRGYHPNARQRRKERQRWREIGIPGAGPAKIRRHDLRR
jgi:hypothetical protein